MITQKIDLNLIHGQVRPRVNVSQFDSGTRTLEIAVYNNTARFTLLGTYTVSIEGRKPDNTAFQYDGIIDTVNNVATFDVTEQMTAVYGDVVVEMVINDGDDRIGTGNFILAVEAAPLNDDSVISESVLPLVQRAADIAETIEDTVLPIRVEKDFAPIISTSDAISKNAIDIKAKIEPVQDLHGYASPWVGGAGKNKLEPTFESGLIDASGADAPNDSFKRSTNYSAVIGGQTYTLSKNGTSINLNIVQYDANKAFVQRSAPSSGGRMTMESNTAFVRIYGLVADIDENGMQLEVGSTATSYEPYTNICPITGWTGAKLTVANENLFNGTYNEFVYCPIPKNTQFTASIDASASGVYFGVYDKYKNNIDYWILSNTTPDGKRKYRVITLNQDVYYVKFYSTQGSNYAVKLGDDKVFAPYATTYIISFGGTRYGGTLDVTSGVLTLTHGYVDLGSLNWEYTTQYTNPLFRTNDIASLIKSPSNVGSLCACISDRYTAGTANDMINVLGYNGRISVYNGNLRITNFNYTDAATFKTAMNGAQLVYELATPQTITLTAEEVALLWAYNTLFGDTGDISLIYDATGILRIAHEKLDIDTFKAVVAASSDFADFKARVAAL